MPSKIRFAIIDCPFKLLLPVPLIVGIAFVGGTVMQCPTGALPSASVAEGAAKG